MSPARMTYDAMIALREGRISADEYRATMREAREAAGPDEAWERAKLAASARDERASIA